MKKEDIKTMSQEELQTMLALLYDYVADNLTEEELEELYKKIQEELMKDMGARFWVSDN